MSFAKIHWDFVQLIRPKLIYFLLRLAMKCFASVYAETVSTPAAVLPAGVTASHVCHTALAAGYSEVHSGDVAVHSGLSECTMTSSESTVASGQRSLTDMAGGHSGW